MSQEPQAEGRATFAAVLAVREYRTIWLAQILSMVGDQLAVVALTWLVYERSRSALLAALTYSIWFVPWLIGGPLLSGLADRYPRREVLVACDVVRAGLVLLIALPGVPLWLAGVLLFVTETLSAPFAAARAALLPDILAGDLYLVGTAIGNITNQVSQVLGFAVGGLLVATVEPGVALALDAVSFLLSAALIAFGVSYRPAARGWAVSPGRSGRRSAPRSLGPSVASDLFSGARLILADPRLRVLAGLGLLAVFYVVPEGLAAPFAAQLAAGPTAVGLLLAAGPLGAIAGSVLVTRWASPERQLALMGPMACATCLPLVGFAVAPGMGWSLVVLTLSGVASAYQVTANATFVATVPSESRGQAFGLIQGALSVGQGVTIVSAGALAYWWSPTSVMALAGLAGCLAAFWLDRRWAGMNRPGLSG